MKLEDFEYYADSQSLERGKTLFKKGHLTLTNHYGMLWNFNVVGTKVYRVRIQIRKNGVIQFEDCTCPYAKRNLCKHVIACLFYIRKELGIEKETMFSKFSKKNQELIEQKDYLKISKKFIQSIFNKIRHQGFIEYKNMPDFANAIDELLGYFESNQEILENKQLALNLCMFLINTICKTKFNCDDSNGEIIHAFYSVTGFIKKYIIETNTELFSILYDNLTNPQNEYEFEIDELLELVYQFAQTDIEKEKIKNISETRNNLHFNFDK